MVPESAIWTGQTTPGVLPLASRPLFDCLDLDEARARVARVYCDHRLEQIGAGVFHACHNRLAGRNLSINVMTYGAKTLIAPGALERFYLFQFPLSGHASVTNGRNQHEIGGGQSGVLNPEDETCMIWSEGCTQLLLQVDRQALMAAARTHFGLPEGQRLRFTGANDMRQGAGRAFLDLVQFAMAEAERGGGLLGSDSLMAGQLEQTLLLGLLETQRHNLMPPSSDRSGGPVPRMVRLAEAYMRENLGAEITLDELARASGSSERALQMAFRAHRGRPPLTVLRDLRMERAWQELSHPAPDTSVTEVATRLGFFHLGRFAENYRKKFGCTPVETLRAARFQ
ncbi:AraC family transcriptional regulator [Phaeovulum sp. W22_SRMD_FR3]|uniref:AraC family transcriptional regulator n=1 Tax=Phaeovulum sp. W22_SRMD_FR3 TaxID=3240274 RepID=UPI003F9AF66A